MNELLFEYLEKSGYTQSVDYKDNIIFYKVFYSQEVQYRCKTNNKFQVLVTNTLSHFTNEQYFDIEYCHETINGHWVKTQYYGLTADELFTNLKIFEKMLIASWIAMNKEVENND